MPVDLAALEKAAKALEDSLHHLELWLAFWTLAVVLGLLIEYGFDLRKYIRNKEWHIIIGGVLITLGVAGELYVEGRASVVETNLRVASDSITAEMNRETADATRQAEVARKDAAAANERAANANERAARANEKAEAERLARIKLQAAITPDRFTEAELKEITSAARPFAQSDIRVLIQTTRGYGMGEGAQLYSALHDAGITVNIETISRAWYEISIGGPPEHWDATSAIAGAIAKHHPLMGVQAILPKGSPITIQVGETLMREFPK